MATNIERDPLLWIGALQRYVEERPTIILRLTEGELEGLMGSRRGITEFTINKPHHLFSGVRTPCLCLIFGIVPAHLSHRRRTEPVAYLGIMDSRGASATLDTRVKVQRTARIRPNTEAELTAMIGDPRHLREFVQRLEGNAPVIPLSPKLSVHVVDSLLGVHGNRASIRTIAESLHRPRLGSVEGRQYDAIQTALKAFGLVADAPASELALATRSQTALARARIIEDAAIEHDARVVPGYEFIGSDVTGRATFRRGVQTLEIYTANRRPLEDLFGVDLIYLNLFKRNIVMLQYKMLEPNRDDETSDWIYREDRHLDGQLSQMHRFLNQSPTPQDYRLNSQTFYMKFVRRRVTAAKTNVLLPLDHFEQLRADTAFRTRSGAMKVSYNALEGHYMRQNTFFGLLQAGYIGAHADTAQHLATLVRGVVEGDEAIVVAVQRLTRKEEHDADRQHLIQSWEDDDLEI